MVEVKKWILILKNSKIQIQNIPDVILFGLQLGPFNFLLFFYLFLLPLDEVNRVTLLLIVKKCIRKSYKSTRTTMIEVKKMDFGIEELEEVITKHPYCMEYKLLPLPG